MFLFIGIAEHEQYYIISCLYQIIILVVTIFSQSPCLMELLLLIYRSDFTVLSDREDCADLNILLILSELIV